MTSKPDLQLKHLTLLRSAKLTSLDTQRRLDQGAGYLGSHIRKQLKDNTPNRLSSYADVKVGHWIACVAYAVLDGTHGSVELAASSVHNSEDSTIKGQMQMWM